MPVRSYKKNSKRSKSLKKNSRTNKNRLRSRTKQYKRGKGALDTYYGAIGMLGVNLAGIILYYTKYKSAPLVTRMLEQEKLANETELLLDKMIILKLKSGDIYRMLNFILTINPKKSGEWIKYIDEDPELYGNFFHLLNNFNTINALVFGIQEQNIPPSWVTPSASLATIQDRVERKFINAEDWKIFIQHFLEKIRELKSYIDTLQIRKLQPGAISGSERLMMDEKARKIAKIFTPELIENLPDNLKAEVLSIVEDTNKYLEVIAMPRSLSVQPVAEQSSVRIRPSRSKLEISETVPE